MRWRSKGKDGAGKGVEEEDAAAAAAAVDVAFATVVWVASSDDCARAGTRACDCDKGLSKYSLTARKVSLNDLFSRAKLSVSGITFQLFFSFQRRNRLQRSYREKNQQ